MISLAVSGVACLSPISCINTTKPVSPFLESSNFLSCTSVVFLPSASPVSAFQSKLAIPFSLNTVFICFFILLYTPP